MIATAGGTEFTVCGMLLPHASTAAMINAWQDLTGLTETKEWVARVRQLKFSRISAHGLPVMDFGGKADPYIVFSTDPKNILMKVKGKAAKSTTKKQTLNPTWEEEIVLNLKVQSEQVNQK